MILFHHKSEYDFSISIHAIQFFFHIKLLSYTTPNSQQQLIKKSPGAFVVSFIYILTSDRVFHCCLSVSFLPHLNPCRISKFLCKQICTIPVVALFHLLFVFFLAFTNLFYFVILLSVIFCFLLVLLTKSKSR